MAELFEARRPKDHAIIAEIDGYVRFGRDYKNKRRITIEPADETLEPVEYMVPKVSIYQWWKVISFKKAIILWMVILRHMIFLQLWV